MPNDEYASLIRQKDRLIQKILSSDKHGRKIYLLGSAEYGPTNEPILIKSTVGLHNKFGENGTLINAFHEIKYTLKDNLVYLVKTTGEHASLSMNVNIFGGDIVEDGFILAASESNEAYNDIQVVAGTSAITITYPEDMNIKKEVWSYEEYPTIGILADAINKKTKLRYGKLNAYYNVDPSTRTKTAFYSCNPTIMYLYGGQCGLNYSKDLLYNCLDRTYEMLESEDIDIIVPVDAFLDDIYPDDAEENEHQYGRKYYHPYKDYLTPDTEGKPRSFMKQLIKFCVRQLRFGVVTHGILGFNPVSRYASDYLYESDILSQMYQACLEWNRAQIEEHFYDFMVSCVAGDIRYNFGTIIDNAYLAYAAFCASVTITEGTTNLPLSNSIALYEEFSEETLAEFAAGGIVAFRHSPLYNRPVVYDGVTSCITDENLRLFVNVRMVQMCISYLNQLYQFYIGWNMVKIVKNNIFYNDTKHILKAIQLAGIITDFNFEIHPYYHDHEIKVDLELLTNYMTKSVKVCAAINGEFLNPEEE